jgi:hypothetical protein
VRAALCICLDMEGMDMDIDMGMDLNRQQHTQRQVALVVWLSRCTHGAAACCVRACPCTAAKLLSVLVWSSSATTPPPTPPPPPPRPSPSTRSRRAHHVPHRSPQVRPRRCPRRAPMPARNGPPRRALRLCPARPAHSGGQLPGGPLLLGQRRSVAGRGPGPHHGPAQEL